MKSDHSRSVRWIRPSRQQRTRATAERFLDAAEQLIEDKGFDDLTLERIAERAGASVSAFYRRFRDKDALLHALHERYIERSLALSREAVAPEQWQGLSLLEILRQTTELAVRVGRSHAGLRRALFQKALADPAFRQRELRMLQRVFDGGRELLQRHRDRVCHPDPDLALDFVQRQIVAMLSRRFEATALDIEGVPLSDEQLVEELMRSAAAYLGIDDARQE
jgi:AcrR family transcriptional regulator